MAAGLAAHTIIKSEGALKTNSNICVFASSCNFLADEYYQEASKLGTLLGQNGFNMVYGGSKLGLMWACAGALKNSGGKLYGVMPEKLNDFGVSSNICDEFYLTSGMRERKAKMDELSDGVIALPGGFGTLEEVSEIIVQKQLGYNNKPIVFINTNGYYNKLFEFMNEIINQKFANRHSKNLYYNAQNSEDALKYLIEYDVSVRNFSKEDLYTR